MASTKDAYRLGLQDGKNGKKPQKFDKQIQLAYDQGYSDATAPSSPAPRGHRTVRTPHSRPFNLGP